ncbi:fructose 1,6-bisphosphate 1-phosphatase [Aureococcus anophagefferens]|nr:fructose 1,6-bisphosphate 1-phosphatase [Aureococcus anophagefferens]
MNRLLLLCVAGAAALQPTLRAALHREKWDVELVAIVEATADCCVAIADRLATLPLTDQTETRSVNVQGEAQQPMGVWCGAAMTAALRPLAASLASEEADAEIAGAAGNGRDALAAAGYALYSASTELVVARAGGPAAPSSPAASSARRRRRAAPGPTTRNDAREPDWPPGLRRWVADAKRGATPASAKYSSRYVCSLVADVHRTLLKGGWAGNPRPHLRLLYEAAPLALVAEGAGAYASDGAGNVLDVPVAELHERVPLFLGSVDDVRDLGARRRPPGPGALRRVTPGPVRQI